MGGRSFIAFLLIVLSNMYLYSKNKNSLSNLFVETGNTSIIHNICISDDEKYMVAVESKEIVIYDINTYVKNSVFTNKILKALKDKKTDTNKDSYISILELSKKLKEPSNSAEYQYPVIRNVGKDVKVEKLKKSEYQIKEIFEFIRGKV